MRMPSIIVACLLMAGAASVLQACEHCSPGLIVVSSVCSDREYVGSGTVRFQWAWHTLSSGMRVRCRRRLVFSSWRNSWVCGPWHIVLGPPGQVCAGCRPGRCCCPGRGLAKVRTSHGRGCDYGKPHHGSGASCPTNRQPSSRPSPKSPVRKRPVRPLPGVHRATLSASAPVAGSCKTRALRHEVDRRAVTVVSPKSGVGSSKGDTRVAGTKPVVVTKRRVRQW